MAMVHARASATPRMCENRRDDDFAAACASCARARSSRPSRSRRVATWRARRARGATSSITTARWDAHGATRRRGCRTTRHSRGARGTRLSRGGVASPPTPKPPPTRFPLRRPFRRLRKRRMTHAPRVWRRLARVSWSGVVPRRRRTVGSRPESFACADPARRSCPNPRDARRVAESSNSPPAANATGVTNRRRVG